VESKAYDPREYRGKVYIEGSEGALFKIDMERRW
jgi:hypothetical protein